MSNLTKEDVLSFIKENEGNSFSVPYIRKNNPVIYEAGRKLFGSWRKTLKAAGVNVVNDEKKLCIEKLRKLSKEDLIDKNLKKNHTELYRTCLRLFGSRKNALLAAGINYEDTLINIPWTKERVISAIQTFHLNNIPLNFKFISTYHSKLRKISEKFFGSWGNAVDSAGLNYEEIKKHGWAKPFLGEDGILYCSQIEGLIANELFILKEKGTILDYLTQQEIAIGKNWTCNFVIFLTNGSKLWLEVDSLTDNPKKQQQLKEKLEFYEKANYFYQKISSHRNVVNIIERFTSWFTIPEVDSLITAHKNPDGDALASIKAVYNHLKSKEKKVAVKVYGEIPKNLSWILDDTDIVKKIPEWVQNIVVLDCAPVKNRLGWEPPSGIPIFNIDHHMSRKEDNDPDNNIHVLQGCSTASLLYTRFGIRDDILAVGVYTDTLFTKYVSEVFYFINDFGIDEDKLSSFISKVNSNPDKKVWDILTSAKVHRCKNGFIIAETDSFGSPDTLESIMQILSKLNESVCFIYGKNRTVKLRTSNPKLDLSVIAKQYSGGGHPYASMCKIEGKLSEFKSKIISLEVPRDKADGYEEK